jgi:hypothetical protein
MAQFTNLTNIPLSLAVWTCHDEYDSNDDPKVISATSLIKPIKQIILGSRVPPDSSPTDISNRINSSIGTAIHNSIEAAWRSSKLTEILLQLGYPKHIATRIKVMESLDQPVGEEYFPVYMEIRSHKDIEGFTISGKFDFVFTGQLEDFKSTSTYTYIKKTNVKQYILQGSIYRWLNPKVITADEMYITYIFTNWEAFKTRETGYPPHKVMRVPYKLMGYQETEQWIRRRLQALQSLWDKPEEDMPACTDEELWREDSVFKYYKNPTKMTRSTANFPTYAEAHVRMSQEGGVGTIVEVKPQPKACLYCKAFPICKQKDQFDLVKE